MCAFDVFTSFVVALHLFKSSSIASGFISKIIFFFLLSRISTTFIDCVAMLTSEMNETTKIAYFDHTFQHFFWFDIDFNLGKSFRVTQ